MGAEYARALRGEKTRTGMSKQKLRDYASKDKDERMAESRARLRSKLGPVPAASPPDSVTPMTVRKPPKQKGGFSSRG